MNSYTDINDETKCTLIKNMISQKISNSLPKKYKDRMGSTRFKNRYCWSNWFIELAFILYFLNLDGLYCAACVFFMQKMGEIMSVTHKAPQNLERCEVWFNKTVSQKHIWCLNKKWMHLWIYMKNLQHV